MKSLFTAIHLLQAVSAAYVWPSRTDHLEDIVYLQSGFIRFGFIDPVAPCSFDTGIPGRQNSAEWIRTAFHDMSTHNVTTGAGGLDASIMFETDRMENAGSAFNNTFGFFSSYYTSRTSASDLLALAVVVSSSICGGERIPYRVGRIDAIEAGPSGVPEPQQDLDVHLGMFKNMGFTREEMIKSVACGHSLGSVHGSNFPEITGNSSTANVEHFDTTFGALDETVVTEYLDGSTKNPLVIGTNNTFNSDARIFNSDKNTTIQTLSKQATFQSECAAIFEKLINTVPRQVTLSEPLEPIEIKPYITSLTIHSPRTLKLQGRIRIRTTAITGRRYDDLEVNLHLKSRNGSAILPVLPAPRATYKLGQSIGLWAESFTWFEYSASVPSDVVGLSGFDVEVVTISTNTSELFRNGPNDDDDEEEGEKKKMKSFPLQDEVLYLKEFSCLNTTLVEGKMRLTVAAGVRIGMLAQGGDGGVRIDLDVKTGRQGAVLPGISRDSYGLESTGLRFEGYELFRVVVPLSAESWNTRFDLVLGEGDNERKVEFLDTTSLAGVACQSMPQ